MVIPLGIPFTNNETMLSVSEATVNESLRNEILKNLKPGIVRKPEVRPYSEISAPARDVLQQFEANLAQLEDLHGRLNFVLNEIRTVVVR